MGDQGELFGRVELGYGFPGTASGGRSTRLVRRGELERDDVERALTGILSEWSGLTEDALLYRGSWPAEQLDAAIVEITGELAEESPDFRSFSVRLTGRELTPGAVLPALFRALGKLPAAWITVTGGTLSTAVTVAEAALASPAKTDAAVASGRRVTVLAADLRVRICTSLPRSC